MTAKTIRMVRSKDAANGGPTEADVHPSEVNNYRAVGFKEAEPVAPQKSSSKEKE